MTDHNYHQTLEEGSQRPGRVKSAPSSPEKVLLITCLIVILAANFIVFSGVLRLGIEMAEQSMPVLWIAMLVIVSMNIVTLTPPDDSGKPRAFSRVFALIIVSLGLFILPVVTFCAGVANILALEG